MIILKFNFYCFAVITKHMCIFGNYYLHWFLWDSYGWFFHLWHFPYKMETFLSESNDNIHWTTIFQLKYKLVQDADFLFTDINMDIISTADCNINLMNTTTAVTPTVPPMPDDLFKFLHNYSSPNAAVCFKMWVSIYSIKVKVVAVVTRSLLIAMTRGSSPGCCSLDLTIQDFP